MKLMVSALNHSNFCLSRFISIHYIAHLTSLGQVSIERGPVTDFVHFDEMIMYSCTSNVSGNEILQFQIYVLHAQRVQFQAFNDRLGGCQIDTSTYSQTICSWPSDGTKMICDYSVPYQITCNLTLSGLTEADSINFSCSSIPGEMLLLQLLSGILVV